MSDTESCWYDQDQHHVRTDATLDDLAQLFEQKVQLLSSTLESVGGKCRQLGGRLSTAEEDARLQSGRQAKARQQIVALHAAC